MDLQGDTGNMVGWRDSGTYNACRIAPFWLYRKGARRTGGFSLGRGTSCKGRVAGEGFAQSVIQGDGAKCSGTDRDVIQRRDTDPIQASAGAYTRLRGAYRPAAQSVQVQAPVSRVRYAERV